MSFFKNNSATKVSQLVKDAEAITAKAVEERDEFPEIWHFDEKFAAAHQAVQKNMTAETVATFTRLATSRDAIQRTVVQLLASCEAERNAKRLLALRPATHAAADEIERALRARLSAVEKSDATASEELAKPFRSVEVLAELTRRLDYIANARALLDQGNVGDAIGALRQAADV